MTVDGEYYEVARTGTLAARVMVLARDNIFDDFMRLCAPTASTTILDVGVSDVLEEGANVLERRYPHPEAIVACGLGEATEFRAAFPAVTYRQIEAGKPLPFADDSFGIATCNAVLEHVGGAAARRVLVDELMRVAPVVFCTVPNRFFPVEHHTAIPLMHFFDTSWKLACRLLGKDKWASSDLLDLMSAKKLQASFSGRATVGHTGIPLGPFSSNLYALVRRT